MASVKEFSVEEKLSSLVRLQKIDSKLDEIPVSYTHLDVYKRQIDA